MARFEYKVASIVALLRCVPAVLGQKDFLGAVCIDSCDNGMRCLKLSGGAFEDCQATSIDVDDPCTCGGVGGEADPFYSGFNGKTFYFIGAPDETFNLLSEESHQLNALLVDSGLPLESDLVAQQAGTNYSTFIGALGFTYMGQHVQVVSDVDGNLTVAVEGKQFMLAEGQWLEGQNARLTLSGDLVVEVTPNDAMYGSTVQIDTPLLHILIFPTRAHLDNVGNFVRGHINLQLSLQDPFLADLPIAHGILGQTLEPAPEIPEPTEIGTEAFPGEGTEMDYVVSGLFASDFPYSRYTFGSEPRPMPEERLSAAVYISQSRRLLATKPQARQTVTKEAPRQQAADGRVLVAQSKGRSL